MTDDAEPVDAERHDPDGSLPICATCGVQYGLESFDRDHCRICEDERQYVGWDGQRWTTMAELRTDRRNRVEEEGPGVWGIGTTPSFAIGQRALLAANVLWDCLSLVDDDSVAFVEEQGGVDAIAISHPHYYGALVDWSRALGGVPVYIHAGDREWITRSDPCIELWWGDTLTLAPGLTLINCGIHFDGGTVLHWADADGGAGAVLSGDILQVVMDRRWVSFMRSYPNLIPEQPTTIERALRLLEPFRFRRIYGAWWGRIVPDDGPGVLTRSARRYLRWAGWDSADPSPARGAARGTARE
jgi:glyoxylase-like metal-dependent hydrolase (beta-lactamase superfamily II)